VDKFLTVRAILHVFVEPGKIEDVGETLAKLMKRNRRLRIRKEDVINGTDKFYLSLFGIDLWP
jgi:hypothetical protein